MATTNLNELKKVAYEMNMKIHKENLVILTWGNASAIDRQRGIMAIKPSGVNYNTLSWQDMVLVNLEGTIINSILKPSSDTLTHIEIYKEFKSIHSIIHTHSTWATIWAQSGKNIPILGTTHADHFCGDIPCLPFLNPKKVSSNYEKETGLQIVNFYKKNKINYEHIPACILRGHAPFVWGNSMQKTIENAIALEACANMAFHSLLINKKSFLPKFILQKHFERKHGKTKYYGQ